MTAYLRDMTGTGPSKGKIQRVNVCSYCKHGTHIIDTTIHPNDFLAKKDSRGKWICGDCVEADIQKMIANSKKRRGVV